MLKSRSNGFCRGDMGLPSLSQANNTKTGQRLLVKPIFVSQCMAQKNRWLAWDALSASAGFLKITKKNTSVESVRWVKSRRSSAPCKIACLGLYGFVVITVVVEISNQTLGRRSPVFQRFSGAVFNLLIVAYRFCSSVHLGCACAVEYREDGRFARLTVMVRSCFINVLTIQFFPGVEFSGRRRCF